MEIIINQPFCSMGKKKRGKYREIIVHYEDQDSQRFQGQKFLIVSNIKPPTQGQYLIYDEENDFCLRSWDSMKNIFSKVSSLMSDMKWWLSDCQILSVLHIRELNLLRRMIVEIDLIESYIRILLYLISKYNSVKIKKPLGTTQGYQLDFCCRIFIFKSTLIFKQEKMKKI